MSGTPSPHPSSDNITHLSGRTFTVARSAWFACFVATTVLFALAIPVRWANLMHPSPTNLANLQVLGLSVSFYAAYLFALEASFSAVFLIVGLFIALRRATDRMALFTALVLVTYGVGTAPTIAALRGLHPALDALLNTLNLVAWVGFGMFFYLFPNGRFVPAWTRWLAAGWLVIAVPWNFAAGSALDPFQWPSWLFAPVIGGFWLSWLLSQVYRYRRVSNAIERQQTKWVLFAAALIIALNVPAFVIGAFVPGYALLAEEQPTPQGMAYLLMTWGLGWPAFLLLPIAIALSILRYRLWEIDFFVNRTLVYGALTLVVIGIYVALVGGFGATFQGNGLRGISLLTTGLVAVIFQPLRDRLQRGVNRLMYGERDDPYAVLSRLRQQLDLALAPTAALPAIAETTAQTLKLPYAAIHLQDDLLAASGNLPQPGQIEAFPIVYQGQTLGRLVVAPRAATEVFSPPERRLLTDIAHQAGVAAHAVRLTTALQLARERLVTAREEERRRLRRDLHDGLGPTLAAQTLKIGAARALYATNPAAADSLLAELERDSENALADVRRLVHNLRPPALDDLGLLGALRAQVAQYESGGVRFALTAPDPPPALPAAVEVAAYRIAQEAVTNVIKHAQAVCCQITIEVGRELALEISDDGRGLPKEHPAGVGLTSMRERAEELGGTLKVEASAQGGTRVLAHLPIADRQ